MSPFNEVGNYPLDLGRVDLDPSEMMFWMYLPISLRGSHFYSLPDNLKQFEPIVRAVLADDRSSFFLRYAYLTVKTLWVSGDYIGNRPGWHIDGYGTDDVNYIWADRAPTEFMGVSSGPPIYLTKDCAESLVALEGLAKHHEEVRGEPFRTYPDKHLLRLDNTVIHRSPVGFEAGMRTFVKVSLSHDQYNLKGNSVNHLLPTTHWSLADRGLDRNHPACKDSK